MTTHNSIQGNVGGTMFAGPRAVNVVRSTVIAKALRFYAKTGMQMNRAYTPKNMMNAAREITGQNFKARDYLDAATALEAHAQANAAIIHAAQPEQPA